MLKEELTSILAALGEVLGHVQDEEQAASLPPQPARSR